MVSWGEKNWRSRSKNKLFLKQHGVFYCPWQGRAMRRVMLLREWVSDVPKPYVIHYSSNGGRFMAYGVRKCNVFVPTKQMVLFLGFARTFVHYFSARLLPNATCWKVAWICQQHAKGRRKRLILRWVMELADGCAFGILRPVRPSL